MSVKVLILFRDNSTLDELLTYIQKNTPTIKIVGVESNGMLGLELFRYFEPDIVLLDINVPIISLEQYIQKMNSVTTNYYIVLFSDRKKSYPLNYQIVKTLQPNDFDKEELLSVFSDITELITRGSNNVTEDETPIEQQTLYDILFGNIPLSEENSEITDKINLDLNQELQIILPKPVYSTETADPYSLRLKIHNALVSIGNGEVLHINGQMCIVINIISGKQNISAENRLNRILYELSKTLCSIAQASFTFFVSESFGMDSLPQRYAESLEYYNYFYFFSANDLYVTAQEIREKLRCSKKISNEDLSKYTDKIFHSLIYENETSLSRNIEEMFISYLKKKMNFSLLREALQNLDVLWHSVKMLFDIKENLPGNEAFSVCYESIEEQCLSLCQIFLSLHRSIKKTNRKINSLVLQAVKFIFCNFKEPLSLSHIADQCNTTSTYLCYLFKKELKINYNDFVTNFRIEYAKKLILQKNMKINEIAQAVGFFDSRYFSRIFKKNTGQTPSEYKYSTSSQIKEIEK